MLLLPPGSLRRWPVWAGLLGACQRCCRPAGGCSLLALRDELSGQIKPLIDCLPVDGEKTAMSHCTACCMHHQPYCLLSLPLSSPLPLFPVVFFPFPPKMSTFDVSAMESKSRVLYLVSPFSSDIFIEKKRGGYQFRSRSVIVELLFTRHTTRPC